MRALLRAAWARRVRDPLTRLLHAEQQERQTAIMAPRRIVECAVCPLALPTRERSHAFSAVRSGRPVEGLRESADKKVPVGV